MSKLSNKKMREALSKLFEEMGEKKNSGEITPEYLQQINSQTTLGNTILRSAATELEYNKYRDSNNKIEFFEEE